MTKYYILVAKMGIMCHCAKLKTMHRKQRQLSMYCMLALQLKLSGLIRLGLYQSLPIGSDRKTVSMLEKTCIGP